MTKQYNFNGKHYTLKPLTLGIMKDIMPVIIKLRKLIYKYTNDIDMTGVNKLRAQIADLEKAKHQLEENMECSDLNDERIQMAERIKKLNDKILLHKAELDNDGELTEKIKLYNECAALAAVEVFSNTPLLKPVIEKLLSCSDNDTEIDLTAPGAVNFLSSVFADFFLLMNRSRAG